MPGTMEDMMLLKEANALIALLDRFLFLHGDTLTSCKPDLSSAFEKSANATRMSATDDYVPLSLRLFDVVDFQDNLEDQRREQQELKDLPARIAALCLDPKMVSEAKSRLAADYALIKPTTDVQAVKKRSIAEMLAQLRTAAQQEPVRTFAISLAATVLLDGQVDEMRTYHLPWTSSRKNVQERLTVMSMSWQAHEAGHPARYCLDDGKWLYQTMTSGHLATITSSDFATTGDYKAMRRAMEKESIDVLVWHETMFARAQELKVEAAAENRDRRSADAEESPRNGDGSKVFLPCFDEWNDVSELMKNEMQELPPPDSESLSEDERDPIVRRKRASRG